MKAFSRILVLLLVGILFSSTLIPLKYTPWASDVREMVQKARAAKRAKAEAAAVAEAKKLGKPAPEKKPAGRKMPKPADFSAKSFAKINSFLFYCGIPFVLTTIILLFSRQIRRRA
ncbi:MAG: hypothetical protein Q4D38_03565 [Planctomycetia bacterium]|nr:hypothetical protein [Planctomycetia bacterium]